MLIVLLSLTLKTSRLVTNYAIGGGPPLRILVVVAKILGGKRRRTKLTTHSSLYNFGYPPYLINFAKSSRPLLLSPLITNVILIVYLLAIALQSQISRITFYTIIIG